jgi:hypothetical protein
MLKNRSGNLFILFMNCSETGFLYSDTVLLEHATIIGKKNIYFLFFYIYA